MTAFRSPQPPAWWSTRSATSMGCQMLWWVRRGVRTLLTVTVLLVVTSLVAVVVIAVATVDRSSRWIDRIARGWARTVLMAAGVRVTVDQHGDLDPTSRYVVVSNHQSAFDIMCALVVMPVPIRFLAKSELFAVPLFGTMLRAMGMVEVDRRARQRGHGAVNAAADAALARGHSLVVFPEGTYSRPDGIDAFKKGAFVIAVRAQVPVLPIAISGSDRVHPPGSHLVHGGPVQVVIGDPIAPGAGITELRDRTEGTVRTMWQALQPSDGVGSHGFGRP